MDRPKSVVRVIRGVAGRAATGGALALQLLRATRIQVQPESIPLFFSPFFLFPYSPCSIRIARELGVCGGVRVYRSDPCGAGKFAVSLGRGKKSH